MGAGRRSATHIRSGPERSWRSTGCPTSSRARTTSRRRRSPRRHAQDGVRRRGATRSCARSASGAPSRAGTRIGSSPSAGKDTFAEFEVGMDPTNPGYRAVDTVSASAGTARRPSRRSSSCARYSREAAGNRLRPLAGARARRRGACPQTSLGDLEDEVMCPVCGTSLGLASESPQAQRERAFIQGLIDDCRSKDEIKDALVAEFGDEVLAAAGRRRLRPRGLPGPARDPARRRRRDRRRRAPLARASGDRRRGPGTRASAESKRLDDDLARYDL